MIDSHYPSQSSKDSNHSMFTISKLFAVRVSMYLILLNCRYLAHGTATDFMFDIVKVPMAFTFEVCQSMALFS